MGYLKKTEAAYRTLRSYKKKGLFRNMCVAYLESVLSACLGMGLTRQISRTGTEFLLRL